MQHLVSFRRALLERNSVKFNYLSHGNNGTIQYDRSGFFGEEAMVIRQLREIFCADDLNVTKFLDGDHSRRTNIPVVNAVIHSLNGFQIDEETQTRLMRLIRRLPPLIVKLAPLNRVGFEDFRPYMRLHQLMIANEKCDMAAYINEVPEGPERLRRIRVFLACFCLGLIAPYRGDSHGGKSSRNATVLQRIIKRIRNV